MIRCGTISDYPLETSTQVKHEGLMQRILILTLFLFGLPGMVDDWNAWMVWLDVSLPPGIGTALVLTAAAWAAIFAYFRAGRGLVIHLPWLGEWLALERFRELEDTLYEFSKRDSIEYAEINEVVLRLKKIDIEYPRAGVDANLRRQVTIDLLAACRAGDLNAARIAWRNAQDRWTERPR